MAIDFREIPQGLRTADAIDATLLGTATDSFEHEIEKGAIRRFAEALQDYNPLYLDESYARAQGYRSVIAPPTFPITLRPPLDPPWLHGIDRSRFLAGEQVFEYVRPIVAGDVLTCRVHFIALEQKNSPRLGALEIITQELRGSDLGGCPVFKHRRISLIRWGGGIEMLKRSV